MAELATMMPALEKQFDPWPHWRMSCLAIDRSVPKNSITRVHDDSSSAPRQKIRCRQRTQPHRDLSGDSRASSESAGNPYCGQWRARNIYARKRAVQLAPRRFAHAADGQLCPVLAIVRRNIPSLSGVHITAAEDEQFRARAYAMGIDLYMERPQHRERDHQLCGLHRVAARARGTRQEYRTS